MKTPTIKPNYQTTIHRDGTASVWDVYRQQWKRYTVASILMERHDLMASLPQTDRDALNSSFQRMVDRTEAA